MSENRFWFVIDKGKLEYVQDNVTGEKITVTELEDLLNEQQNTLNKLREILAEAEDMIEVRLAEHYIKEYENIKHHIIGDNDE